MARERERENIYRSYFYQSSAYVFKVYSALAFHLVLRRVFMKRWNYVMEIKMYIMAKVRRHQWKTSFSKLNF